VRAGWTAGAGWENMLTERLSAKAEYLYYDLGTLSLADPPTGGVVFRVDNAQFRGNIARFGLNYKL
jgi:outer membrane immunogenic protein